MTAGAGETPGDGHWLDSHCHLTADGFAEDRAAVVERAARAGVATMIAIGSGYGFAGNGQAVALAQRDPRIFATVGVHPHEAAEVAAGSSGSTASTGSTASNWDAEVLPALRAWLAEPRVLAIGECGLDYHYMNSPRDAQREAFARQVALARELALPVSIHVRGDDASAYDDLLDIWCAEGGGAVAGVLHCYTGSLAFARRALDENLWLSFSGIVTFGKSDALRDTARALPPDRLLIETDAPFLAPQGHRGRRNEPAWVTVVGETLARLHDIPAPELARITGANARALFRIPEPR